MEDLRCFDKNVMQDKSKTRKFKTLKVNRGIAQPGSASALGIHNLPCKYKLKRTVYGV